jgi:hypothetical protein
MAEYVSNREFFDKYCEWKKVYREAKELGIDTPQVTNYLGDCILKINNNLVKRFNFANYSYRSEMAEDGIETCFRAFKNFDETKYTNIFGYFNKVAWQACVKRIKIEHRHQNLKIKLIADAVFEGISRQEFDDEDYQMQMREIIVSTMDSNSMDDSIRALGIKNLDYETVSHKEEGLEVAETEMDIY